MGCQSILNHNHKFKVEVRVHIMQHIYNQFNRSMNIKTKHLRDHCCQTL
jgi:hypothetical protein